MGIIYFMYMPIFLYCFTLEIDAGMYANTDLYMYIIIYDLFGQVWRWVGREFARRKKGKYKRKY